MDRKRPPVTQYVALGDSMSIDVYPAQDAARRGFGSVTGRFGAASLLFRNDDAIWPELRALDLRTMGVPERAFHCLAWDGATSADLVGDQLPRLPRPRGGRTLVTITAGGNDLLWQIFSGPRDLSAHVQALHDNLESAISVLRARFRDPTVILTTIYDPTDGSGDLGDGVNRSDALKWLDEANDSIRDVAASGGCLLADAYREFQGHGLSCPDASKRYFWEDSIIEPSLWGASRLREIWMKVGAPAA